MSHATSARPVVLVACCGSKLPHAAPAQDLYVSDLFRKSRAYAEAFGCAWYVLSAKHGLLLPGQVVAPYDLTLNRMTRPELMAWEASVLEQWRAVQADDVVMLAGRLYRGWTPRASGTFTVPMQGLSIGHQKAWLKRQLAAAP